MPRLSDETAEAITDGDLQVFGHGTVVGVRQPVGRQLQKALQDVGQYEGGTKFDTLTEKLLDKLEHLEQRNAKHLNLFFFFLI
jgi:hypothetical protein